MKRSIILVPLVFGGCATGVYHPTKPAALMQADIDLCTEQATLSETIRVATTQDIVACLKDKGYVNKGSVRTSGAASQPAEPALPCAVPCRPKR